MILYIETLFSTFLFGKIVISDPLPSSSPYYIYPLHPNKPKDDLSFPIMVSAVKVVKIVILTRHEKYNTNSNRKNGS
jgi:hypothetical protein